MRNISNEGIEQVELTEPWKAVLMVLVVYVLPEGIVPALRKLRTKVAL